jgi:50S ribosomal protein L16 3-hydroxylase
MSESSDHASFWDVFVREHWEQRPGVFRTVFSPALISPRQAFDGAIEACTRWREGQPALLRFFIENALVQSSLDKYLPVRADAGFDRYAERMTPKLRGQGFALVVNGFSYYDFPLFVRARSFLRGLYERVGIPGDATDLDLFVGNYRHTPFGIHTDTASNFSVVFQGRKRFLLWPGPILQGRRDTFHSVDFEEVRAQAIVLEAEAGDVVYWPSSYWHIAESDGSLSGVLNIALYLGDFGKRFVDSAESPTTSKASASPEPTLPWDSHPSGAAILPEQLERAIRSESDPRSREASRRQAVSRAWLKRITAYNFFRSMPPVAPHRPLKPDDCVQVDAEFPIVVWVDDARLVCAAHGHTIEVPAVPRVRELIERLNSGAPSTIRELIERATGSARVGELAIDVRSEDILLLLENLLAMRAISKAMA